MLDGKYQCHKPVFTWMTFSIGSFEHDTVPVWRETKKQMVSPLQTGLADLEATRVWCGLCVYNVIDTHLVLTKLMMYRTVFFLLAGRKGQDKHVLVHKTNCSMASAYILSFFWANVTLIWRFSLSWNFWLKQKKTNCFSVCVFVCVCQDNLFMQTVSYINHKSVQHFYTSMHTVMLAHPPPPTHDAKHNFTFFSF